MTNYRESILGVGITFSIVAVALTAARIWARSLSGRKVGLNDWLVVISTVLTVGLCVAVEWGAVYCPLDEPAQTWPKERAIVFRKLLWSLELVSTFIIGTVKICVLLLYKQILDCKPRFHVVANAMMLVSGTWTLTFCLLIVFKRFPRYNEFSYASEPHVVNPGAMWLSMALADSVLDVTILTLPFPVLARLQTDWRKKLLVSGIIFLGVFVVIASITRMVYFARAEPIIGEPLYNYSDSVLNVVLWTALEACFSTIAANLLLLMPLFVKGQGLNSLAHQMLTYGSKMLTRTRSSSTLHSDSVGHVQLSNSAVMEGVKSDNPTKQGC